MIDSNLVLLRLRNLAFSPQGTLSGTRLWDGIQASHLPNFTRCQGNRDGRTLGRDSAWPVLVCVSCGWRHPCWFPQSTLCLSWHPHATWWAGPERAMRSRRGPARIQQESRVVWLQDLESPPPQSGSREMVTQRTIAITNRAALCHQGFRWEDLRKSWSHSAHRGKSRCPSDGFQLFSYNRCHLFIYYLFYFLFPRFFFFFFFIGAW